MLHPSLKILHVLDHSLPLQSGYSFRSHNIMCAQQRRGWAPVAITSPKQEENHGGGTRIEHIDDIRYHRAGHVYRDNKKKQSQIGVMLALASRLRNLAREERPDIIHAHSPVLNALPALLVGRQLHIPVVYEIRAFWEDAAVNHGTYDAKSWRYGLVRRLETWACRRAGHVFVICNGLAGDLEARGLESRKITIIPNGVNLENFKVSEPDLEYKSAWCLEGKKVIAFFGSFYRYEGLDLLVKSFAFLAGRHSDVVLLLVGGGPAETELRKQVDALGLSERVVMPSRISHDRIPGLYALADFLVYPRYSMRLTELVTPLKPLEAMAMSRAVIASDIGGHRELIRHMQTGLLFPPGNETALFECMEMMLTDPNLRCTLAERGATWIRQERSWSQTTEPYASAYSDVLAGKYQLD